MLKTYKYRIYPTKEQRQAFAHHFGCARYVYNWGLNRKKEYYEETGKNISYFSMTAELTVKKKDPEVSWLKEVNAQSLNASLYNLDRAYTNFFKKRALFPRFKSRDNNSFAVAQRAEIDFIRRVLHIPKIRDIPIVLHRRFDGIVKTCTIRKTPSGRYYVSVLVDDGEPEPTLAPLQFASILGIALSDGNELCFSDGTALKNPEFLDSELKRIVKLQKRLSKTVKGSKRREKIRVALARLHERIANRRQDYLHKVAYRIVYKGNQTSIAFPEEDIRSKLSTSDNEQARKLADTAWQKFTTFVKYKCAWSGKNVISIKDVDEGFKMRYKYGVDRAIAVKELAAHTIG